jgi:hypothetical protein
MALFILCDVPAHAGSHDLLFTTSIFFAMPVGEK